MRLHYYKFPDEIDAHTRFLNGASNSNGECLKGRDSCSGCSINNSGWTECEHYKCLDAEDTISGISVTAAKKLLKKFGGAAWTQHCERDGGCFEVTPITLKGNHSRFKYSRHL